jgi:hypothetical protein
MKYFFTYLIALVLFTSCKRQEVNEYNLNPVVVNQNGAKKENLKSSDQFISLLYADLYETSISYSQLKKLQRLLDSFGDKNVIIERIAQNMLNDPLAKIPNDSVLSSDLDGFIKNTYTLFLTRNPSEAEVWYIRDLVNENSSLTVKEIYYGFITSEEYKYY